MEWRDEGVLLSARPHGETSVIAEVFTAAHGRHGGVVRGGASRRMAAHLQPGAQVAATWRARLDDHLGSFTLEPLRARAGVLGDAGRLAALTSACALLRLALPERDPHGSLWQATVALFDALESGEDTWAGDYLRWELGLLEDIGFGLDLSACAVTGVTQGLAYVSPRTGRAVSIQGAGEWADRLLPLPACLTLRGPALPTAVAEGLALTGHFLARELAQDRRGTALPEARARLVRVLGGSA
jgi:DNA repair protein RecO (recombination protein O)